MLAKHSAAVLAVLYFAAPAAAQEVRAPRFILTTVDWPAAAESVPQASGSPAAIFDSLNKSLTPRFPGIDKSPVPVLLPFDLAAYRADQENGNADASTSSKYFGGFAPANFFLAGPAGYDAVFSIDANEAGIKFPTSKPVEIEVGGAAYLYDLDEPNYKEVFAPPNELAVKFPGIKRILSENHVRYAFERFGVPYVVSIQCYDRRPARRYLTCREADPIAQRFLNRLAVAGGTPAGAPTQPKIDLSRPSPVSPDFTYYAPGDLIPNSGWHKMPGRADYTVYARVRFPIASAPAYIKSQSFMHWGDCYRTGRVGSIGRKDAPYRCKANDRPLLFNEANPENWSYPWRDNFCETRDFLVGQCPGGYGHQGQDIRPSSCVLATERSDRCLPDQHAVAAVHDGLMWRRLGNLGAYIVFNNANEHVRFRYLHMNPRMMDANGLMSGRQISEGENLGTVSTWGDKERGTSYHLHFNLQVFTKVGWVWVNPYMTLVAAYERLIGARGTEIKAPEPAPPTADSPTVVLPLPRAPAIADAAPPKPAAVKAVKHAKTKKAVASKKKAAASKLKNARHKKAKGPKRRTKRH